jgi:hydroxyacylglutathione hydrolase
MALTIVQFRCRTDNYGVLVHHDETGATAAIDAPDADVIRATLERNQWRLDTILTTHHHGDHVAGNLALKEAYGCTIIGPAREAAKIPGIDQAVDDGDSAVAAGATARVMATPGHTLGHISYFMNDAGAVFVGDTLFAMGCGRLFEGDAQTMWASLRRLAALPPATRVYCGHDYAAANARFALTIEPENPALVARAAEVAARSAEGLLTLPTTIALELKTNPFLRADQPAIRDRLKMNRAAPAEVFAEIRRRKDGFG